MVDQISDDFARQPVVFLEYTYGIVLGLRQSRMFAAIPGPTYYYPLIIVDSGNTWSMGPTDYNTDYRALANAALPRPAGGEISVQRERVGDTFEFAVTVTNNTGVTLSSANSATVHAIVFEDDPAGISRVTDRYVREVSYTAIGSLADGASDTYNLTVDLTGMGVDWSAVHSVVLVDYRPGGATGAFDTMQAAFQP